MTLFTIRPGIELDLSGLPWGISHILLPTLRNPQCSADLALILADSVADLKPLLDPWSAFTPGIIRLEADLRALAPLSQEAPMRPLEYFAATACSFGIFAGGKYIAAAFLIIDMWIKNL